MKQKRLILRFKTDFCHELIPFNSNRLGGFLTGYFFGQVKLYENKSLEKYGNTIFNHRI